VAVSAHVYGQFAAGLATKTMNLSSDAIKVALVTSSYTPAQATDQFWSTPQANEITGTGYTAGGAALTSVSITDTSNVWTLSAANTSWSTATFTARYAVVYDSTPGTAATDPLIAYVDFGANQSPSGVTFSINWSSGQVLTITAT
jgi:hypothetical protein